MNKKKWIQTPSKPSEKHQTRNCGGKRVRGEAEKHCGGSFSMGNPGVHFSRYPPKYSITWVLDEYYASIILVSRVKHIISLVLPPLLWLRFALARCV
jgi:hypothetical protein